VLWATTSAGGAFSSNHHPDVVLTSLEVYFRNGLVGVSVKKPLNGKAQSLNVLVRPI